MTERIVHNRAECGKCGGIIESKNRHDFVRCPCGEIFVDGGTAYLRRGGGDLVNIIDRSEYDPPRDGVERE